MFDLIIRMLSFGRAVHGELQGEALDLVVEHLRKVVKNSNCDGKTRPGRKPHACAVVTHDGYVFFGVSVRQKNAEVVRCAEDVALTNAAAMGRWNIVCAVVYSPNYVPKCCGSCLDRLSEHVGTRHGDLPIIYVGRRSRDEKDGDSDPDVVLLEGNGDDEDSMVTTVCVSLKDGYSAKHRPGDFKREHREETPNTGTCRVKLPDECAAELSLDSLRDRSIPEQTREFLRERLSSLLMRSSYWGKTQEGAGARATVVAVITRDGVAYCGVNLQYGVPHDCHTATSTAIGLAITDGAKGFVALTGLIADHPDEIPLQLTDVDRLRDHLDPEFGDIMICWDGKGCLLNSSDFPWGELIN